MYETQKFLPGSFKVGS